MTNATVLVVDDEDLIRWSLPERLDAEGYAIRDAAAGADAMERVSEGVDLVLLDDRLPDTDGLAVLPRHEEPPSGCADCAADVGFDAHERPADILAQAGNISRRRVGSAG